MGTGTARREVMSGGLRVQLLEFADRRPAVLVLGGSECNLDTTAFTAAWVTTAGYHALAVDSCEQRVIERLPGGGQGVRFAPAFEASLAAATPAQRAAAAIAIGPAPASFLLAGGADDGVWPAGREGPLLPGRALCLRSPDGALSFIRACGAGRLGRRVDVGGRLHGRIWLGPRGPCGSACIRCW